MSDFHKETLEILEPLNKTLKSNNGNSYVRRYDPYAYCKKAGDFNRNIYLTKRRKVMPCNRK